MYMWYKSSCQEDETFMSMQDFLSITLPSVACKSNIEYARVMDAVADTGDTMMAMLQDLHKSYVIGQRKKHLVVEGDAKLYEILKSQKYEYEEDLAWLYPMRGDWHTLKNYQVALLKPYFDAGLKNLAEVAGYPVQQIRSCSHFKRTHLFSLETWEAAYQSMIMSFREASANTEETTSLLEQIHTSLQKLQRNKQQFHKNFTDSLNAFGDKILVQSNRFKAFVQQMAQKDNTWKFWAQYVFQDGMAYVSLFLAIRSGNWGLRVKPASNRWCQSSLPLITQHIKR